MTRAPAEVVWQLAGLDVDMPRAAASAWDRPPFVELDGDVLRWRFIRLDGDDEMVSFGPIRIAAWPVATDSGYRLLFEFAHLAEKGHAAVRDFARTWGLLHPCGHQLPRTHPPLPGERHMGRFCPSVDPTAVSGVEPLAAWTVWSLMVRSALGLASSLRDGSFGDPAEWGVILPSHRVPGVLGGSIVEAADALSATIELWLRLGRVETRLDLTEPRSLRVTGFEMFGAMALQLAAVVTSSAGPAFCSGCGLAYAPDRKPPSARRRYCDGCRASGVPGRDAAAAYRARRAQG